MASRMFGDILKVLLDYGDGIKLDAPLTPPDSSESGPVKALVEHGAEVPDHLDEAELDKIDKMLRRFAALDRKRARVEKGQQTE